jgi:hypothetical protein
MDHLDDLDESNVITEPEENKYGKKRSKKKNMEQQDWTDGKEHKINRLKQMTRKELQNENKK